MALPRSPSERRPQANEPIFDSHRLPIASSPAPLRHLPFLEPWRICFPSSLRASHQGLVSGEALAGFGSPTPSRHRASAGSSDHAGSIGWGRGPLPVTACPGAAGDGDMWQQFPSAVSLLHGCGGERTCRPRGGRGPADPGGGEDPRTQGWQRTRRPRGGRGPADPGVGEDPQTQGWQRTCRPRGGRGSADPGVAEDPQTWGWERICRPKGGSGPSGWLLVRARTQELALAARRGRIHLPAGITREHCTGSWQGLHHRSCMPSVTVCHRAGWWQRWHAATEGGKGGDEALRSLPWKENFLLVWNGCAGGCRRTSGCVGWGAKIGSLCGGLGRCAWIIVAGGVTQPPDSPPRPLPLHLNRDYFILSEWLKH